jgi:hypothetical protein
MTSAVPLIPSPPSPWKICNIDEMLRAQRHEALDDVLDTALAASFSDRAGEAHYLDAWPGDLAGCIGAGAEGLARLHAWQQARPGSAHAHLCEAHYWYQWALRYRADRWNCVTASQSRALVSALQAVTLAPAMWPATGLLLEVVDALGEPEWLSELVHAGHRPAEVLRDEVRFDPDDEDDDGAEEGEEEDGDGDGEAVKREPRPVIDLAALMARSGLTAHDTLVLPTARPPALPGPLFAEGDAEDVLYWLQATLHLHPRLFAFLQRAVPILLTCGSRAPDYVRSLVVSPVCAHLDAVERSRLLHPLWQKEYADYSLYGDEDDQHVQKAMADTRRWASEALWPLGPP